MRARVGRGAGGKSSGDVGIVGCIVVNSRNWVRLYNVVILFGSGT